MQPIPYFGEKIAGMWIYEPKIDGWRMQIVSYETGEIECWGRRLERKPNWSAKLHSLIEAMDDIIPPGTILDCELHSSGGRRFIPSLFVRNPKVKPVVYVFDIIYYKGTNISKETLRRRKSMLARIHFKKPLYPVFGKKLTNLKRHYMSEVKKGNEGIIIKKYDSPYMIGKESPIATHWWRKIK